MATVGTSRMIELLRRRCGSRPLRSRPAPAISSSAIWTVVFSSARPILCGARSFPPMSTANATSQVVKGTIRPSTTRARTSGTLRSTRPSAAPTTCVTVTSTPER